MSLEQLGLALLALAVVAGAGLLIRRALEDRQELLDLDRHLDRIVPRLAPGEGMAMQQGRHARAGCACTWRGRLFRGMSDEYLLGLARLDLELHAAAGCADRAVMRARS